MTFVDDAELVWRLTERLTQEQAAKAMGWGRTSIANYVAMKSIDDDAWAVVTETLSSVTDKGDEDVTGDVTTVTKSPFSENLLRNILDLGPEQQLELCRKTDRKPTFSAVPFQHH